MTDLATYASPVSPATARDTTRTTVSVCIPAYQAEEHLRATINSVLAQQCADVEVVVVDNHSTDGTATVLSQIDDPRVRVVRNPITVSMVDNFNIAVRESRGDYVKLVCADDLLTPQCVRIQSSVLDKYPSVSLVSARTDFVDDRGRIMRPARGIRGIVGKKPSQEVARRIVRSGTNPIGPPVAAMFRRADFERCGGFRDDSLFLMDLDLWVRLLQRGEFYGLATALASFRIRSDSSTALTSARSQLAQQLAFAHGIASDAQWSVSAGDQLWGRARTYDMQLRRTGLYLLGARRAHRRRGGGGSDAG
ncbi:glycosyltransferase involved in cell wall biosynthesis [Mycolicibacterium iranicum]|uniref:Glycosyltransferase involved in cell wall biosynthesis n=1 Tax=Mycolicibacterium iranicum TaxID=912594 RepID=A0A839Q890_MYCIR|nr:glycosyltransferase [Mycolicibacterium iranicum]MBB2989442.1 glycosyltransferase involved in cell wall biosynthesis [Mycolicibacterium iranicum]